MAACGKVVTRMTAETQLPDVHWASRAGVQGQGRLKPELWGACHST